MTANIQLAVNNEPEFLNDAEILGTETAGLDEFLSREASFLVGEMWGARDRRNTQDGDWKRTAMPWGVWIGGMAGNANAPAWGFSRHPVGKDKAGACMVLGSSVGGARKAKAMDTMYAMGLDIDSGAKLNDVLDIVEAKGLLCFVYTSYNHGKRGIELKRDEVLRKLQITRDPDVSEVRKFLREFDKNRYEETFIAECTIREQKHQTSEGVKLILDTPPLEKFRLIFPLETPVKLIDLADTQQAALDLWEDKITGLARNVLGVHFDTSCTDPSRLFYTARHPKGNDDWYAAIVMGNPLSFDSIEAFKKSIYTSNREVNAFTMAGGDEGDDRPPMALTPSGKSLNEWHRSAKDRFMLADLVETLCPDKVRVAGGEAQGHVHTECPFEHEHSSEGGTATMAINCLDSQNEYWTWFCHHDACQSRHKLQFLEEALRAGWFEESVLTDLDAGFLLEAEDDENSVIEAPKDRTARHKERAASVCDDLMSLVAGFDDDTTEPEVREVIRLALSASADKVVQNRLKAAVVNKTAIGAKTYNDLWKEEARLFQKPNKRPKAGELEVCQWKADHPDQLDYARRRIVESNVQRPRLFQFGGAYATADAVRHRIRLIEDRDSMNYELQAVTRWEVSEKIGDEYVPRLVAPPESVVRVLYKDHAFADTLPELLAVVSTPFFDAEGRLVDNDGYHAGAKVFLAKGGLAMERVSAVPSTEEVAEAKRLLVEEVLADFPLGGMDRTQIVGTLTGDNPENAHAVTHAVAMALLPFCREMIAGPTPGHVYTKPGPGTGASLLVDVLTTITTGAPAPAMTFPTRAEEVGKTLSAALAEGAPVILFDNIGQAIASSELASAMTGTSYQARILGRTQLVMVPVRTVWVFTANNIEASGEILRRFVLIPLDAGVPDPEQRKPKSGWQHPNIKRWVTDNRPVLVWACLTIIQNWVAKGMERQETASLASYEDWAGVMGGILASAGFYGFLGGQAAERAKATDATEDGLSQLVQIMGEYPDGTVFRPGGNGEFDGKRTVCVMDILNGIERHGKKAEADEDPIQINGWGYSPFDGAYKTAGRIGRAMKILARKPYQIAGQLLTFTELTDTRNKSAVFRLSKTPGK
jgi:hypothetical protein